MIYLEGAAMIHWSGQRRFGLILDSKEPNWVENHEIIAPDWKLNSWFPWSTVSPSCDELSFHAPRDQAFRNAILFSLQGCRKLEPGRLLITHECHRHVILLNPINVAISQ